MGDKIIKATAGNGSVRAFVINSKDTVENMRKIHNTSPVVSAALGRLITVAAMMGSMLKGSRDILTLTIKGDGPIGGLLATGDSKGNVKGYPYNPNVDLPLNKDGKLDVSGAVGKGFLNISKDIGLKEPYSGQIELVSGEIAEDLTYYFATSEQTPSSVGLGVLVDTDLTIKAAGGFIIQLMPDANEEHIKILEKNISNLKPVTSLYNEGKTAEDILKILLDGLDIKINEEVPVYYNCNCSKERVTRALVSLGKDELIKILNEDKKAVMHCHFCNSEYVFTEEDLKGIIDFMIS